MDDFESLADARFPHGAEPVKERAANEAATGAQCARFQDILAAANAPVHVDFDFLAHGIHNGRQRFDA